MKLNNIIKSKKMKNQKSIQCLVGYYGLLQFIHLITLARAGVLLFLGNGSPFPILPPSEGWATQTMPFLFGLAATDLIGIFLGIVFAFKMFIKHKFLPNLGKLSLTIFITGAIVFAAGTLPTGAWAEHPIAYGIMVILFIPVIFLMFMLFNSKQTQYNIE
jgi:hypothetical protein